MLIRYSLIIVLALTSSGCSSLGLSLWPAEFPLLRRTRQIAKESPPRAALPRELAQTVLPNYYVEPGDRVLIEPNELDSDFRPIGDQEVRIDGSIDLGRFGRIRVAGLTVENVERAIESQIELVSGEQESINVQLVESNAAEVYVLGAVASPGTYPIAGNELVLDGILLAGGLSSNASPCDIILVRPTNPNSCRVVLPVCYRQITQLGDTSTNYQLRPGDRILVGARTFCEELAIWRQSFPCRCCDNTCCAERHPQRVQYRNPFNRLLSAFPLPAQLEEKVDEAEVEPDLLPDTAQDLNEATSNRQDRIVPGEEIELEVTPPGETSDEDVFLDTPEERPNE